MIETLTLPELACRPLPAFDVADWKDVERAFASMDSCRLRQAWRKEPEADFEPAQVRVGWRENELWVYAELDDRDIFNCATQLNDATYDLGDIFEIFVRPVVQDIYYELHVTPENQQLQLRWPEARTIFEKPGDDHASLAPYFVSGILQSYTMVQPERNKWRVLAAVPASKVAESKNIQNGDVWTFSFSRYDRTRGSDAVVFSSSSPHAAISYHRQQEWGRLTFFAE